MKTNNTPLISNKKKYLALLPFTVLSASAFISNPAQANYHCNQNEDSNSLNLTCNDTGTDDFDTIGIDTGSKKNINVIVNSSESLTGEGNIYIYSKYLPKTTDDFGNVAVSLQKGSINTSNMSGISINAAGSSGDKNYKINMDVNLDKDFKIQVQDVVGYINLDHGLYISNKSKGIRNNLTVDGDISVVSNTQYRKYNHYDMNYGHAVGILNLFDPLSEVPENETYTTINKNANIFVKGVLAGKGVYLKTEAHSYSTNSKVFFTMNGGNINVIGAKSVGIDSVVDYEYVKSSIQGYEGSKSLVKLNLNAGNINVRGENEVIKFTSSSSIEFVKTIGVQAKAKTVEIDQGAQNSIQVTGRNSDAMRVTGRTISLNLAGNIISDENAIYIEEDSKSTLGLTNSTINITDSATIIAGNGSNSSYILYDSEGVSNTTIGKAEINGSFYLAGGDDTLTFNGTDVSNVGIINGGSGFDKVSFANYNQESYLNASQLKNLERIDLNGNTLNLSGTKLKLASGTHGSEKGGLFLNNATLRINNEADNRRPAQEVFTLTSDIHNLEGSTIDLRNNTNPDYFNTLTINGDYYGGGTIIFNSKAGNDGSSSDKLVLNGDVHGSTKLVVNNKGGLGDATAEGIKVIELADNSTVAEGKNAFTLEGTVEAGAYEYNTLAYTDANGKKGFYLQSRATAGTDTSGSDASGSDSNGDTSTTIDANSGERGDTSTIIDKSGRTIHQLRPAVTGYVLAQQINAQALNDLNAGLHQRAGEQRAETNYINRNQSWVRTIGTKTTLDVNNLGSTNNHFGLQVGYDFKATHTDDLRNRAGVFASYSQINSTLTDSHRKEFHIPGRVATDLASFGVYHTTNLGNSYLDLVGSLHFLHNDYAITKGGQQNAFGGNLSVEGGYNLDLGNNFFVEPQVQLSYQGTRYADFKDAVNNEIKGYTHQSLRPRLGLRLGYHDVKGTNLWLHANLETEVLKTAKLTIGNDLVSVDRAGKYLYDLGLNGQVALSPTTVLYGSAQYKGSFDKKTTLSTGEKVKATKLNGFGGEVGLRFTW